MLPTSPATRLRSIPVVATIITYALAGSVVLTIFNTRQDGPLGTDPGTLLGLAHVVTLYYAAILAVVAHGLWRGSRRAAVVAGAMLSVLGLIGIVTGGHTIVTGLALAGVGTIAVGHRAFRVGAARDGTRLPAAFVAAAVTGAWAVAAAVLWSADIVTQLAMVPGAAASWLVNGSWWLTSSTPLALLLQVIVVAGLTAGAVLICRALRPATGAEGHSPAEHARAAAIVAAYATDSLAPFVLREDKSYHFACGGMLAYRTVRGTAVVSGDPIGPPGSAPAILADFEAAAATRGWDVVVTAAGERHLSDYRSAGFRTVCIGEEAVVDPATFSLAGGSMKALRHSVNRQGRLGWSIELVTGDALDPELIGELESVEQTWRASQPRLTGFAMTLGRLWGASEDSRSLYVLGRDPHGQLKAFLSFAEYSGGLSLDAMRRIGETPNGLNDAMVVSAIGYAQDHELSSVSLNFAGFAHLMAPGQPLTRRQRAARWLLTRAHGRFQLERLMSFNKKFGPQWKRRYVVLRDPSRLPALGLRVLQAEAYVRPPRARLLVNRWQPLALSAANHLPLPHPAP